MAPGLCSIAEGSDSGGSIRGLAACCGLVGIKPYRVRVSQAPAGKRIAVWGLITPWQETCLMQQPC